MHARAAIAVAVTVALAYGLAPAARAHDADPSIATTVVGVAPQIPGVTASVVEGVVPGLSLSNSSPHPLYALGPDGTPFLRIGPGGTYANLNARAFYLSTVPGGETVVPPRAHAHAAADWVRISARSAWAFYDQRIPAIGALPPAIRAQTTARLLARFTVPLRYGAQSAQVDGVVEYRPPFGGAVAKLDTPLHPAPAVTIALVPGQYPELFVSSTGEGTVTVLGEDGEPFAEIGPVGVRVNARSPTHAADLVARGERPTITPSAVGPPLWRQASSASTYAWFDPRIHYERAEPPSGALTSGRMTRLRTFDIPLSVSGRRVGVVGEIDWVPSAQTARLAPHGRPPGSSSAWPWLGPLLAALGVAAAWAAARRLRRRRPAAR